ncbi:MAG: hypothetical protein ACFCUJ_13470 [Thiotrichales bacterium]
MNWDTLGASLIEALQDEYRARARYTKTLERYGPLPPFTAIVAAEQRHVEALLELFHRYRIPIPPDHWPAQVAYPSDLAAACAAGVAGEINNIKLYDRLLHQVAQADVRHTFFHLQRASRESHLPAFRRCLAELEGLADRPSQTTVDRALLLGVAAGATLVYLLNRGISSARVKVPG